MKTATSIFLLFILYPSGIFADTFGSGVNTFHVEFVAIGDPGNLPDTTGDPNPVGAVPYSYRIGKYEISKQMVDMASDLGNLNLLTSHGGPNRPATGISWFGVTTFVNWLNTSGGNTPAYKFDSEGNFQLWQPSDEGYDPNNLYRNSHAKYFLPSIHEWYKAAYFDPTTSTYYDYPTGSNAPPIPVSSGTEIGTAVYDQSVYIGPADIALAGGLSPYGTMAQGGNVWEWEETDFDLVNDSTSSATLRGLRGGSFFYDSDALAAFSRLGIHAGESGPGGGFRIASIAVPEPSALLLAAISGLGLLFTIRR